MGQGADPLAAEVAAQRGVSLDGHIARQFTPALGRDSDLILVMEPRQRNEIARTAPELLGRCFLFDHWNGSRGVPDPYRKSREFHESVFEQIRDAGEGWTAWLQAQTERRR